ncbi:hypothetical protein Zm00014a_023238 [Zea mays]|uniref:Uncharacterized protein n=1 Tax=Zea mays TaxID=4577 RepID=A0A3L6GCU9_MAIZE|nr:hypothetical protein Zm00014a_023238 [Zea mays]
MQRGCFEPTTCFQVVRLIAISRN